MEWFKPPTKKKASFAPLALPEPIQLNFQPLIDWEKTFSKKVLPPFTKMDH
jgi:hypothetical protein